MLIIVSGPSGVGKSRLLNLCVDGLGWRTVVPWTTRPIREGERAGSGYQFCNRDRFREWIESGVMEFWDYTVGNYYGYDATLRERAERGDTVIIQALARMGIRIAAAIDGSATVFLRAADERTLFERLRQRGYDERELSLRREHWAEEREHSAMFDIQIDEAELADTDAILRVMRETMQSLG